MSLIRLLVPLLLLAHPAQAAMRDCRADFIALTEHPLFADLQATYPGLAHLGDALPESLPDTEWCELENIAIAPGNTGGFVPSYGIDQIRWQADWPEDARVFPPQGLNLTISGIFGLISQGGVDASLSPDMAYQLQLSNLGDKSDITLHYAYDRSSGQLDLITLDLDGPGANDLILSATLNNLPAEVFAGHIPRGDSFIGVSLSKADLTLRNQSFFQGKAFMWLRAIFPRFGDTPDAAVERAKRLAVMQLGEIPDQLIDPVSKDAVAAAIGTLPNPNGELHLHLAAPDPLGADDLLAMGMAGDKRWQVMAQRLPDLRITAQWIPAAPANRR